MSLSTAQRDYIQSDERNIITRESAGYARSQGMKSHAT